MASTQSDSHTESDGPSTPPKKEGSSLPPTPDTPITLKVSGSEPFTSEHMMTDTRTRRIGEELKGKVGGPLPVNDFLKLLPNPPSEMPWTTDDGKRFQKIIKPKNEVDRCPHIVRLYNEICIFAFSDLAFRSVDGSAEALCAGFHLC